MITAGENALDNITNRDFIAIEMAKSIITVDWNNLSMTTIAEFAYRMADEMIERSKK